MTEPKPIHRLEETPGGVRVVTKDLSNLYDYRSANVLKREYSALFTSCVPKKGGPERVQIASAAHYGDSSEWQIHGVNGIYAEVSLTERELSAAECAYYDEHMMSRDTEPVVEFSIPHPEELRAAVRKNNAFPTSCFEAVIEDSDRRIETEVRANQLKPQIGILTNLALKCRSEVANSSTFTRWKMSRFVS